MKSIVEEITDDFCLSFEDGNYGGACARLVGMGLLPEGVDPGDPRVVEIIGKCRAASHSTKEAP